ncbi:hypothetical protein [Lactobacillus brevis] [Lactiplantibacillus mudanjiangensis]|uniref:hypothetical protein n=1 Tax=Lactiplantibacillus mudanjiangensis TaxID=1296538 RepID=UPI001014342E|nr:hypothetical protein [Lactobacillus brevis] [Lactiplantibacillus mudanjiangensis]
MRMNSDLERAFKNIIKHVPDYQTVLKSLHVENGDAIASDGHQILLVKKFAPKGMSFDLRLDTFEFADPKNKYPETAEIWPRYHNVGFEVPSTRLRPLLKLLKALNSDMPIKLSFDGAGMTLNHANKSDGIQFSYTMPVLNYDCASATASDIYCNPEFLIDAFTFFTSKQFQYCVATFKFGEAAAPFTISTKADVGEVKYLIAPMDMKER